MGPTVLVSRGPALCVSLSEVRPGPCVSGHRSITDTVNLTLILYSATGSVTPVWCRSEHLTYCGAKARTTSEARTTTAVAAEVRITSL